jgi:hypothetical protein
LYAPEVISADLDRPAALQHGDGGWVVDFNSASLAGMLEWHGHLTVQPIDTLRRNGRA